jgi:hypothetical protein
MRGTLCTLSVTQTTTEDGPSLMSTAPIEDSCTHDPHCPPREANDCRAARIISDHLQDCGYALLCNGLILLEGDDLLPVPIQRTKTSVAKSA